MNPALISLLLGVTLLLAVATVAVLQHGQARTRALLDSAEAGGRASSLFQDADRRFRRTRAGRTVARMLAGSGRASWSVLGFSVVVVLAAGTAAMVSYPFVGKAASVIIFVACVAAVRQWLSRQQGHRVEKFIAQLPELARLMSNGASAGLGIQRSLEMAARELSEPARTEIEQVSGELAVGQSMAMALQHLSERLPSRELSVLIHTLVIQQRAGGALTTALSRIAATLDDRKQLRREARTAAVGSLFTGSAVLIMVGFAVVIANAMSPGVIDQMLMNPLGQIALLLSTVLFFAGFLLMRRIAKVDI